MDTSKLTKSAFLAHVEAVTGELHGIWPFRTNGRINVAFPDGRIVQITQNHPDAPMMYGNGKEGFFAGWRVKYAASYESPETPEIKTRVYADDLEELLPLCGNLQFAPSERDLCYKARAARMSRNASLVDILTDMCADVTCTEHKMCPICGCIEKIVYTYGEFECRTYGSTWKLVEIMQFDQFAVARVLDKALFNNLISSESHALIREHIPISAECYERAWWPKIAALYA